MVRGEVAGILQVQCVIDGCVLWKRCGRHGDQNARLSLLGLSLLGLSNLRPLKAPAPKPPHGPIKACSSEATSCVRWIERLWPSETHQWMDRGHAAGHHCFAGEDSAAPPVLGRALNWLGCPEDPKTFDARWRR